MKNLIITCAVLLSLLFSSCITDYDGSFFGQGIKGEGPITSKTLNHDGFTAVAISTSGELHLSQGDTYSVKVESHQNIIDNLETEVSGGTLKIGFDKPASSIESLKFFVTLPSLSGVSLAGSADVTGDSPFTGLENVDLEIAGSGNVRLNLEAKAVDISIAGSGDIELEGTADGIEANIKGSGSVKAGSLSVRTAEVNIAGSGDCTIDATEQLEVNIAGSGNVYYLQSPEVERSIAGSGSVERK